MNRPFELTIPFILGSRSWNYHIKSHHTQTHFGRPLGVCFEWPCCNPHDEVAEGGAALSTFVLQIGQSVHRRNLCGRMRSKGPKRHLVKNGKQNAWKMSQNGRHHVHPYWMILNDIEHMYICQRQLWHIKAQCPAIHQCNSHGIRVHKEAVGPWNFVFLSKSWTKINNCMILCIHTHTYTHHITNPIYSMYIYIYRIFESTWYYIVKIIYTYHLSYIVCYM